MPMRCAPSTVRLGSAIALVLVLAGCTPGGQFDPTTLFSSDMFDTKKKIQGQREPLFPNGVPGTQTGVPAELVKGYKPPPDQAADDNAAADAGAAKSAGGPAAAPSSAAPHPATQTAAAHPKPKPIPKPKLARAPVQPQDNAFNKKPATRITVGLVPKASASAQQGGPASPQNAAAQQTAQPSQSIWPAPPQSGSAQQAAQPVDPLWGAPPQIPPAQQTAQPAQSVWPNPPPTGTSAQ